MNGSTAALIVAGGAMRGIFASGVLDAFLARGFMAFDFAMGVSAGLDLLEKGVATGAPFERIGPR